MKRFIAVLIAVLMLALVASAQDIKFPPGLDKLAAKATETVDVSLDGQMLQLASGYLSNKDSDEAETKNLVRDLKGIYVKSFEFDKPGEYSPADVDFVRSQLTAPTWSRVVQVKEPNEAVEVYFKYENGRVGGLMLIAAEPKELTLVHIIGPINLQQLKNLSGHFGIPNTGGSQESKTTNGTKDAKDVKK